MKVLVTGTAGFIGHHLALCRPDLSPVVSAVEIVGRRLKTGDIVVVTWLPGASACASSF